MQPAGLRDFPQIAPVDLAEGCSQPTWNTTKRKTLQLTATGFSGYAFALLATAAALVGRLEGARYFGGRAALVVFTLPVVLSAFCCGAGPGLVATAAGAIAADLFLFPHPARSLLPAPQDLTQWLCFVASGVLISALCGQLRGARARASRLAEEQRHLAEARERLVAIIDWSQDAIIGKTLDGVITSWNLGAEGIFGYTAAEAVGQPMLMLIPPDRANEEPEILARIRRGEVIPPFDTVRVRKDGRAIDVSVTISPIRDNRGVVVGASKIARDIGERRRAEAALRAAEDRYHSTLDSLLEAGQLLNFNWEYLYVNPAAALQNRRPNAELLGRKMQEVWPGIEATEVFGLFQRCMMERIATYGQIDFHFPDGHHGWFEVRCHPVPEGIFILSVEVTERRRAERHNAELAEIVRGMSEACFALDAEWRFTFFNDRAVSLLRQERDAVLGRTIWDVFAALRGTSTERQYRRAMADRIPVAFEAWSPVAERWVDIRLFPSGSGLAAFLLDIQARKEAESSLHLFRMLMDRSRECIEVIDCDTGRVLDVNEEACRRRGCSRDDYLALTVFDLNPELKREQFFATTDRLRREGGVVVEGIHRRPDATEYPVELSLSLVKADRDYVVVFARDITERKKAAADLRASEERFRQVVENIQEVFWMTDATRNSVLYVSPGYARIWGRSCESLTSAAAPWPSGVSGDDRERVEAAIGHSGGAAWDLTYRIARPEGGLRWIRDRGFPISGAGGRIVRWVGVAEDITAAKRLEQQFLRAQRLEAIGTLSSGIAHDLNNILAPMLMLIPALQPRLSHPRDQELVQLVEQSAKRGASIIRQLLTFSRGIEGERGPVQLRHLIREMAGILRETLPRNIVVAADVPADVWPIYADATQLHQVLLNLCVNARDAMPEGGRLTLSAENRQLGKVEVEMHPPAAPGRYVVVTVADTGMGIPAELKDRIFEPFFTTKPIGKGTGLGLSTAVGIVKSHQGFINVYSEPGRGCVFKVCLPAEKGAEEGAVAKPASSARGNRELIMIVDDEPAVLQTAARALEAQGYRVQPVAGAREAVQLFLERQTEIRLLITDLMMPEMDGVALIRTLRTISPGLPIIAASGLQDRMRSGELAQLGVTEVLAKPFAFEELLEAIRTRLEPGPAQQ